ncbi:MAG: flagellar filament capping protein FliD [Planctomycetota bacterium]
MGTISSSGLISGLDTQNLIDQLIQAASGPSRLAQNRLIGLQTEQAALLDITSSLSALRSTAGAFRVNSSFAAKSASSTNTDVLTATASSFAQETTSTFIVDRLVTTRQQLSRGFADRDSSPLGATSFTFESEKARLERDVSLSLFNDGEGFTRGSIDITDDDGDTATIDLSRAATVQDILDAVNEASIDTVASVSDGRIVFSNVDRISNTGSREVVESLGFTPDVNGDVIAAVDTLESATVFGLSSITSLGELNDGLGILLDDTIDVGGATSPDFIVTVDDGGTTREIEVNLGSIYEDDDDGAPVEQEGPVTDIAGVIARFEAAAAEVDGVGVDVTLSANIETGALEFSTGGGVTITSIASAGASQAAEGLGIDGVSSAGSLSGDRILAGLSTRLAKNLNGGNGIAGSGFITFTDRDGTSSFVTGLSSLTTLEEVISSINSQLETAGNGITVGLNDAGTGLLVTDNTSGAGEIVVAGTAGFNTAESLGIETTGAGVGNATFRGSSLQLQYIGESTLLSELNNDSGVSTGSFEIRNGLGETATINITEDDTTIQDVIDRINSAFSGNTVTASINANGDGILLTDSTGGNVALRVSDTSGSPAADLRIEGEAADPDTSNTIDGTFEVTVEFDASDTLDDVVDKINLDENSPVGVSVIDDGSSARPFRLSFISNEAGRDGRYVFDTNGFDLELSTLDEGEDARVFFGSNSTESAVLLTSSSNTLDGVFQGVSIDLRATSDEPVTLTVSQNTSEVEDDIADFVSAFNNVLDRIERQTRFVEETNERGPLLGKSTIISLRNTLFDAVNGNPQGFTTGFDRLPEVGITVGEGGRLSFDRDQFREALEENPEAVEDLFTRRTIDPDGGVLDFSTDDVEITVDDPTARTQFTELGIIPFLEEELSRYVDTVDGILTREGETLDSRVTLQQDRIVRLQGNLDRERERLERQFIALERSLADIQGQQSALASLAGLG